MFNLHSITNYISKNGYPSYPKISIFRLINSMSNDIFFQTNKYSNARKIKIIYAPVNIDIQ